MTAPVLMFGIGATKSGTSWLYSYLAAHPECYLRSIKELHFFDTIEKGSNGWHLKEFARKAEDLEAKLTGSLPGKDGWNALHLAEVRLYAKVLKKGDENGYLEFLTEGLENQRVVGDITPCYALLSEESLSRMARMAEKVRFVYLMRDPVARLWSHIRMIARRRSKTGKDIDQRAAWIFNRTLSGGEEHILMRGDYQKALEKLRAVVDPEQVFVCTYEDLFSDATLARLCAFLGITPVPGDTERQVHVGVAAAMSAEQKSRAAAFLRPQYEYVAARLGRLPAAWEANMAGI